MATFICAITILFVAMPPAATQNVFGAFVARRSFDFGTVRQGEVLEHSFTVENRGSVIEKIRVLGPPNADMKIQTPPEIRPGGRISITVAWDTRALRGETAMKVSVQLSKSGAVTLDLKANVVGRADVVFSPAVF